MILGIVILSGTIGFFMLLWFILEDDPIMVVVSCLPLLVAILCFVAELVTPVTVTETRVLTNDYARYGLHIESKEIGHVKIVETDGVWKGTTLKDKTEYFFVGFEEN